jgi:hypothetical protein
MADLKITKAAVKPAVNALSSGLSGKAKPSAFDQIQATIAAKVAADLKLPPLAQVTPQQAASLENGLKNRIEKTDARSAAELFAPDIKNTKAALGNLTAAVAKLPQQNALNPIRQRLEAVDQQFQRSGSLVNATKEMDPKSLLKVQMQMYQVSENIELLSKVVDQMSSGVKTIMQTQV